MREHFLKVVDEELIMNTCDDMHDPVYSLREVVLYQLLSCLDMTEDEYFGYDYEDEETKTFLKKASLSIQGFNY